MSQDKSEFEGITGESITEQQAELPADNHAFDLPESHGDTDPLEKLETDLAEAKDKYLRLYSEFDNFRRRSAKERLDLIATAGKDVIESLIPVLDDFERALKHMSAEDESTKGVELIYQKFKKLLENKGLNKMEIAIGDEFNPELQEAITQIPAPSDDLAGKIVDVIEAGYYLNDKVLRFAKVVTAAKA